MVWHTLSALHKISVMLWHTTSALHEKAVMVWHTLSAHTPNFSHAVTYDVGATPNAVMLCRWYTRAAWHALHWCEAGLHSGNTALVPLYVRPLAKRGTLCLLQVFGRTGELVITKDTSMNSLSSGGSDAGSPTLCPSSCSSFSTSSSSSSLSLCLSSSSVSSSSVASSSMTLIPSSCVRKRQQPISKIPRFQGDCNVHNSKTNADFCCGWLIAQRTSRSAKSARTG